LAASNDRFANAFSVTVSFTVANPGFVNPGLELANAFGVRPCCNQRSAQNAEGVRQFKLRVANGGKTR
jgi:hypothetical protein